MLAADRDWHWLGWLGLGLRTGLTRGLDDPSDRFAQRNLGRSLRKREGGKRLRSVVRQRRDVCKQERFGVVPYTPPSKHAHTPPYGMMTPDQSSQRRRHPKQTVPTGYM